MKVAQTDNYPEYGRPSPRVTENWLNHHLQRGTEWGSFYVMLEKLSSYSAEKETILIFFPVLLTVSKGIKNKRELLLFPKLWTSGYSFLLISKGCHVAIWDGASSHLEAWQVYLMFSYVKRCDLRIALHVFHADKLFLDDTVWVWDDQHRFKDLTIWSWAGGTVRETCGSFTRCSLAAGSGSVGAGFEFWSCFLSSFCFLIVDTMWLTHLLSCLPYHNGPYPLKLWVQISPFPLSCFLLGIEPYQARK